MQIYIIFLFIFPPEEIYNEKAKADDDFECKVYKKKIIRVMIGTSFIRHK